MKQREKMPSGKVKVRFTDCDPFNHLNNSKYIDYFLNAREDHLLNYYDFDLNRIAREKALSWVVGQNQIVYLAPATLMETVSIQTRLIAFEEKTLLMEAIMSSEDQKILKSVLWSKFVHFNLKTKKSEVHSEELMGLFRDIIHPLDAVLSFEERVMQIRQLQGLAA